jgi:hypothetical protein
MERRMSLPKEEGERRIRSCGLLKKRGSIADAIGDLFSWYGPKRSIMTTGGEYK